MKRKTNKYGGIGSAAVNKATCRTWAECLAVLDKVGAAKMPHRDIARLLTTRHQLADWWSQVVAVGDEQARGLHVRHPKADG